MLLPSTWSAFLEVLLLVAALSIDAFLASFAYGSNKIQIPFTSVAILSGICSAILALSLAAGSWISQFLSLKATNGLCFAILLGLGFTKLFDCSVKAWIRNHQDMKKSIRFHLFSVSCILQVYVNPIQADRDDSRILSPAEAASLAIALSLDGLGAGFGAGLTDIPYLTTILLSLATTILAVVSGSLSGNKTAEKIQKDLSWLGGIFLIVLAFLKFFL